MFPKPVLQDPKPFTFFCLPACSFLVFSGLECLVWVHWGFGMCSNVDCIESLRTNFGNIGVDEFCIAADGVQSVKLYNYNDAFIPITILWCSIWHMLGDPDKLPAYTKLFYQECSHLRLKEGLAPFLY